MADCDILGVLGDKDCVVVLRGDTTWKDLEFLNILMPIKPKGPKINNC